MFGLIKRVAKDMFTGPDGESYAPGRLLAAVFAVGGHVVLAGKMALEHAIDLKDLAVYYPALAGAIVMLITGTNPTEPKAPPPPAPPPAPPPPGGMPPPPGK